jgi:hypothetical protein
LSGNYTTPLILYKNTPLICIFAEECYPEIGMFLDEVSKVSVTFAVEALPPDLFDHSSLLFNYQKKRS